MEGHAAEIKVKPQQVHATSVVKKGILHESAQFLTRYCVYTWEKLPQHTLFPRRFLLLSILY